MLDDKQGSAFPTDDSLCEQCGYPLRGLMIDSCCPECDQRIAESSPARRDLVFADNKRHPISYYRQFVLFAFRPKSTFRRLSVDHLGLAPERFHFRTIFLAASIFSLVLLLFDVLLPWPRLHSDMLVHSLGWFVACVFVLNILTLVESLGVAVFSRRRGWRVPYRLAYSVCCYASVGWLPGVLLGALGLGFLRHYAAGQMWFDRLLGLVPVSWICLGALFVVSLLWFETLVWLAVRQVKYANSWQNGESAGESAGPPSDPVGAGEAQYPDN